MVDTLHTSKEKNVGALLPTDRLPLDGKSKICSLVANVVGKGKKRKEKNKTKQKKHLITIHIYFYLSIKPYGLPVY